MTPPSTFMAGEPSAARGGAWSLVAEEPLELGGQLIAARERTRVERAHSGLALGVVARLELLDHRDVLLVVGDQRVEAVPGGLRLLVERSGVEAQRTHAGEP